jgi:hypothetical protein
MFYCGLTYFYLNKIDLFILHLITYFLLSHSLMRYFHLLFLGFICYLLKFLLIFLDLLLLIIINLHLNLITVQNNFFVQMLTNISNNIFLLYIHLLILIIMLLYPIIFYLLLIDIHHVYI